MIEQSLHGCTDATVWASAFANIWLEHPADHDMISESLMVTWFANAIESGREAGRKTLNDYAVQSHEDNMLWWTPVGDARPHKRGSLIRNKGELLMLIVSEIAEAMEGERKDLMDDKLPTRKAVEVELADALIRIFDYAGAFGLDLEGAYQEKREFNAARYDHSHAARSLEGGKQF